MAKESTYSKYWDQYIEDDLQVEQAGRDDLEWPGDEWGTQEQWENIYQLMFVRTGGVERWSRAVEIGQGSGKYTLKVLANPQVTVRAYDVSARFLDVCRERCAAEVEAGRLSLHRIDPGTPRYLLSNLTEAGWRRQVDAVYSIEAMVHVDLQYLMAYLLTAAAVLEAGREAHPDPGHGQHRPWFREAALRRAQLSGTRRQTRPAATSTNG